jgi:hypothetical protein
MDFVLEALKLALEVLEEGFERLYVFQASLDVLKPQGILHMNSQRCVVYCICVRSLECDRSANGRKIAKQDA